MKIQKRSLKNCYIRIGEIVEYNKKKIYMSKKVTLIGMRVMDVVFMLRVCYVTNREILY